MRWPGNILVQFFAAVLILGGGLLAQTRQICPKIGQFRSFWVRYCLTGSWPFQFHQNCNFRPKNGRLCPYRSRGQVLVILAHWYNVCHNDQCENNVSILPWFFHVKPQNDKFGQIMALAAHWESFMLANCLRRTGCSYDRVSTFFIII